MYIATYINNYFTKLSITTNMTEFMKRMLHGKKNIFHSHKIAWMYLAAV